MLYCVSTLAHAIGFSLTGFAVGASLSIYRGMRQGPGGNGGKMEQGLSPESITSKLETRFVGQRVIHYASVVSTMDEARREAQRGAAEGTVIIADGQTGGKGRVGRVWLSPRGSIALSIILYPGMSHLSSLIMIASLSVVHAIQTVTGLTARIKWPNDILINGRKVCGILIESDVRKDQVHYAIIGIGINANIRLSDCSEIQTIATSLSGELGREVSCLEMVRALMVEMEKMYRSLLSGVPVYEGWRDGLVTLGRRVQVRSGKSTLEGIAESVARDGSLMLRRQDGSLIEIVAGDVTLRDY